MFGENEMFDQLFDTASDFEANEKVYFLDKAIEETSQIHKRLESTLGLIQRLSSKYGAPVMNYLHTISPGVSCEFPEYLSLNIDSMINEENRKYEMESPRRCQMQEMMTSTDSSKLQNEKGFYNHQARSGLFRRHKKVDFKKIKLRYEIESAIMGVRRAINISEEKSTRAKNYFFKEETPEKASPCRERKSPRRTFSPVSCRAGRNSIHDHHNFKPAWNLICAY